MTSSQFDDRLIQALQQVAPGTHLREGLERILRAEKGALVVLGAPPQVQALFTGGFRIEVPFTAQRLSELAKMDGALVLDTAARNILWANVHLMPDPAIPTSETGTRHRTAERVAKQTGVPVVTVSESMHILTLYLDDLRHVFDNVANVLSRSNQTVQTLEHYRARFDELAGHLTGLELDGAATQRDVLAVLARAEMLCRIAEELERYVAELGVDGRLLRLQLDELAAGVNEAKMLVVRDYLPTRDSLDVSGVLAKLAGLTPEELSDTVALAKVVNLTRDPEALEAVLAPRGYRALAKVPELPGWVIDRVAERFGSLKVLLTASLEDLEEVEGIDRDRARQVRDGLGRLAEASMVEYYP
ncbi:MAG TPA: DNA integrity scanning diadenylate cyclase DisA [Actinomycetes bacterium]|jgi:diadenylate cyclase|nr:DNA integrity scanning diadenylate cyclase DisA [Actinomycetes bacterium]